MDDLTFKMTLKMLQDSQSKLVQHQLEETYRSIHSNKAKTKTPERQAYASQTQLVNKPQQAKRFGMGFNFLHAVLRAI